MPTERTAEAPTCSNKEVWDWTALWDSTEQIPSEPGLEDNIGLGLDPAPRLCSFTPTPIAHNRVRGVHYFLVPGDACLSAISTTGACRLPPPGIIGLVWQCIAPEEDKGPAAPRLCGDQAQNAQLLHSVFEEAADVTSSVSRACRMQFRALLITG